MCFTGKTEQPARKVTETQDEKQEEMNFFCKYIKIKKKK